MNTLPTYKPAYFVALFVDTSTGVPRSLSSPPTLVGKSISSWGLVDWFDGTMVAVSGATGAYAYKDAYVASGDQGYMAWPQWSDQNVRLAYFGSPVYALTELSYLDASVSSRMDGTSYVVPPAAADVQAAVWGRALPAAGTNNMAAGLAALADALLGWTSSSGEASGSLAIAGHSCQYSGTGLSADSTPTATRCGGYCNQGAYLYFTQSAALSGVTSATLNIYCASTGTGYVSVELSADPADPSTASTLSGRTFSQPIAVSFSSGNIQVDITSLLQELAATAPGGIHIGIKVEVLDGSTTLNFTTFGEEHQASLTVQQTVQTPHPAVPALDGQVVESNETALETLRLLRAALLGNTTGGGTATHRFKSADGAIDRITAVVDSAGNRTVTVDPS